MNETNQRLNLKVFRVEQKLSQEQMAGRLGIHRSTYAMIERGERNGNPDTWHKLQDVFNVPDADMWRLMQKEG